MRGLALSLSIVFALCSTAAHAVRTVETVGSAVIVNGAVEIARNQAINDATRAAALQISANIETSSTVFENALVVDSSRVNSSATVEDLHVIEEWQIDDILFVRIRANTSSQNAKAVSIAAGYRKKIAVLQFAVAQRRQTQDLPNIERELPRELLRKLELTGIFLPLDGSDYLLESPYSAVNSDNAQTVVKMAQRLGVQTLVTGVIKDFSVDKGILFSSRHVEIEVSVFDGISGAKLATHNFSEKIEDQGYYNSEGTLFSLTSARNDRLSAVLNRILDRQVELVSNDLDKIPFSARVIKADGQSITFDAGNTSLVRVGDTLMAFRVIPEAVRANNQRFLGYQEEPLATLVVKKVQPSFAVGELEIKDTQLFAGDLIRFGL